MEITPEVLNQIYERAEQVFLAKTGHKPQSIKLDSDGKLHCYRSFSISYGGEETISRTLNAFDLTADLDQLIEKRKVHEAKKKEEQQIKNDKAKKIEDERKLRERKAQFEKLKKEFED
jgi:hypothetical protein